MSSANAQDASSANVNAAIRFNGPAAEDLLASENAVLEFSGGTLLQVPLAAPRQSPGVSIQVLTERAVKDEALQIVDRAKSGERIGLAMFYLSDRDVIRALIRVRAQEIRHPQSARGS